MTDTLPTVEQPFSVDCVVGTRPNFVKISPIVRALRRRPQVSTRLIHTGQHYDASMDKIFFDELEIPTPDVNLMCGAGRGGEQVARIMLALQPLFLTGRPDLLVVVGDVNSTLAAALAATYLAIPIAHVEAGLRSFDRTMPEEINRLLVDQLADLHFVSESAGIDNLMAERIAPERIKLVGNVMIDSLFACLPRAVTPAETFAAAGASQAFAVAAQARGFGFVTLHRPSNVDDPGRLAGLLQALAGISERLPLIFAVHPRTKASLTRFGLAPLLAAPFLLATAPLGYLGALGLMREAQVVMTDSGGIQEETTALGVPCLTLRDNTERPITIEQGTNSLVGSGSAALEAAVAAILANGGKRGRIPKLWDGQAAERIADAVVLFLQRRARCRVKGEAAIEPRPNGWRSAPLRSAGP